MPPLPPPPPPLLLLLAPGFRVKILRFINDKGWFQVWGSGVRLLIVGMTVLNPVSGAFP
jgi:hypothetical protein